MKKIGQFILFTLLSIFALTQMGLAQCPTTSIVLTSQSEIDNFPSSYPNCTSTSPEVNITIQDFPEGDADISNVDSLNCLVQVAGSLKIENTSLLANVDGLNNLVSSGDLYLFNAPSLNDLDGLNSLNTLTGNLSIVFCSSISNLDGLSQLTNVGGNMDVGLMPSLSNVDGLSQLSSIGGNFELYNNTQLNECCGVYPLLLADESDPTVIAGSTSITFNPGCDSVAEILSNPSCVAIVPTLGQWGTIILSFILLCLGIIGIAQREVLLGTGKVHS